MTQDEMTRELVQECVRQYANKTHWQTQYQQPAKWCINTALRVTGKALGVSEDTVRGWLVAQGSPPWTTRERGDWVRRATNNICGSLR